MCSLILSGEPESRYCSVYHRERGKDAVLPENFRKFLLCFLVQSLKYYSDINQAGVLSALILFFSKGNGVLKNYSSAQLYFVLLLGYISKVITFGLLASNNLWLQRIMTSLLAEAGDAINSWKTQYFFSQKKCIFISARISRNQDLKELFFFKKEFILEYIASSTHFNKNN